MEGVLTDAELRLECFRTVIGKVFEEDDSGDYIGFATKQAERLYAFVTAGAKPQPERDKRGRFRTASLDHPIARAVEMVRQDAAPEPDPEPEPVNHADDALKPKSLLHRAFGSFG